MTLYNRPRAEVFADNAPPSEIQPFQAWLRGLGIAFDETNGLPEMTGLNGLFNALNQYIKYLEQNGFAEWSADLEYPIGAGVRVGSIWYRARTRNTNKPPATSQNDWAVFLNGADVASASTTVRGVVRFATALEVAYRSNVQAAVRPSDIPQPSMVPDATTSTKGIVQLNNTLTSTNTTQALTAAQGRALNMQMLGVGQTWQNVTGSRSLGVTYTNTTGRPIMVSVSLPDTNNQSPTVTTNVGGVNILINNYDSGSGISSFSHSFVVPIGATYRISVNISVPITTWAELR